MFFLYVGNEGLERVDFDDKGSKMFQLVFLVKICVKSYFRWHTRDLLPVFNLEYRARLLYSHHKMNIIFQ